MRARDWLQVGFVGAVAFGGAALAKEAQENGGWRWPSWVPFLGNPLIDWEPDTHAMERDLRALRWEAARLPAVWDAAEGKPDIVLIVMDTVRADHLGIYGYDRGTSPKLDAWAADARVYEDVVADAPWTLPSHASLFTGRSSRSHGAHGTPPGDGIAAPLGDMETLAEALRLSGYRTMGIAANQAFLSSAWGLARGFDLWLCEGLVPDVHRLPYVSADRVTAMAREALSRPRPAPLFLFLNYMDAHTPWIPREGYVRDVDAIDWRHLPYSKGWERSVELLLANHTLDPVAQRAWNEAYDAGIRYEDDHLGELLDALPGLGIGPEDYVFIVSDHGEYLGEHDLVEHSKDVYEPVLRVPLVVHGPGYAPGRDSTPLQLHDLSTWILAAAGQAPLDGAVHTADLRVAEEYYARQRDLANPAYGARFNRVRRAFYLGFKKLILGSDGSKEAYDLAADPLEQTNLVGAEWVAPLEARAQAWLDGTPEAQAATLGKGVDMDALQGLGYVE